MMETLLSFRFASARTHLLAAALAGLLAALLAAGGCQKAISRTSDPQLKPIQEMLDAQIPAKAPEATVLTFLSNRGFPVLPAGEQRTVVTTIRHIDPQTVTPVTARVTFYFDSNGKLDNYELQRTFNEPPPKAEAPQETPPTEAPQQGQSTQQ